MLSILAVASVAFLTVAPLQTAEDAPVTRTVDHVDEYHGVEVADPYRWLEDDVRVSDEVGAWVGEQNGHTQAWLEQLPGREALEARLTDLWDYERYSAPRKVGRRYVFSKNDGLQNQSVLYVQDGLEGTPRVLLDPNGWSTDGTVALSGSSASDDGRYLAFARSSAGSDWRTWFVLDMQTGAELDDELHWIKWGGPSWMPDGRGFLYTRFPEPAEGEAFQALNLHSKIYYHRVGTAQDEDVLVFEDPAHPEHGYRASVTDDGRWLLIYASKGTDPRNMLFVRDLSEPLAAPTRLIDDFDHGWSVLGNDGSELYIKTDFEAPMGRIVRIDVSKGRDSLEEIVPESAMPMRGASLTGNLFVCSYLEHVLPLVRMFRTDGRHVRDVEFPGIGTASGFGGERDDTETFYSFMSFDTPPSIYRYDLVTGESTLFRRSELDVDPDDYVVEQVFYTSKDGTQVPMFVAHRRGLELDGDNPTLLYGYGGFNISQTPRFSVANLAWMEMGGVYAVPNIRGGGEYGNAWHEAGTKLQKQNVFDDFIAAGEWLVDTGYTKPERLAIFGGSNGGLLVGACMTQRPDLFGAAIPAVGVMDMLRFHTWTAGRYWVDDYGSSDDPEEFAALLAYSPYHNIKPGTEYPATMVTTADTDDRVVPGHSFKFAAALQAAQTGDAPVLIRIDTNAGHGAGKPTSKRIQQYADMWAFLAEALGMEIPTP